ncbi:hypothetical protein [Burkholderia vietnamiensis]|uniref:hypothetical protein n=1 Tax=Burkholderia vietnamiensis TaxID=60552 RepID=UPI001CF4F8CA|nr:hypothetical protein [Burkholderia vietnamiensis]MCA8448909.1 hypothetical protein [Burkholderia vietnamiensis]
MDVQCTTAELPRILPILAKLSAAFHLTVTDAPTETVAVPAASVAPAVAPAAVTAGKARWYSADEVVAIIGYSKDRTVRLVKRAGIDAILMNQSGKRGDTRSYFDADKVDELKAMLDDTWTEREAADLMGDKSVNPIRHHTKQRRITPTIVAGKTRYKTKDIHELMRYRKIA